MRTPGSVCSAHLLIVSLHVLGNTGEGRLMHRTPSNTPIGAPEVCGLEWGELLGAPFWFCFFFALSITQESPHFICQKGPLG